MFPVNACESKKYGLRGIYGPHPRASAEKFSGGPTKKDQKIAKTYQKNSTIKPLSTIFIS